MMTLDQALKALNEGQKDGKEIAAKAVKTASDEQLEFYLVMRDTSSTLTPGTKKAIAIVQVEINRRERNETRFLTVLSVLLSGALGIAGVLIGIAFAS